MIDTSGAQPGPSASILIIGNEILSGKTQDANLQFLARQLTRLGIRLMEARVVRDDVDTIAAELNRCRTRYDYVFTTGGIGPTHDDVTAEAVARAFATTLKLDEDAVARLARGGRELNPARLKMAMIPEGASLIDNPVSHAPGFRIDNVFVLAGIPSVAQAMFEALEQALVGGLEIRSSSLDVFLSEGDIAGPLEAIATEHPEVEIGSYPFSRGGRFGTSLVVRGTDQALIGEVMTRIEVFVDELIKARGA